MNPNKECKYDEEDTNEEYKYDEEDKEEDEEEY